MGNGREEKGEKELSILAEAMLDAKLSRRKLSKMVECHRVVSKWVLNDDMLLIM